MSDVKRGRSLAQPGTKYSLETIEEAHQLYLKGESYTNIVKIIKEKTGKPFNMSRLKRWIDDKRWPDERKAIVVQADDSLTKIIAGDIVERQKVQLDAYKEMSKRGIDELKDGKIPVDSIKDVIDLIDKGIRGERQIAAGLVSLDMMEQIANIIAEEVLDENVKRRIVTRFQRYVWGMMTAG